MAVPSKGGGGKSARAGGGGSGGAAAKSTAASGGSASAASTGAFGSAAQMDAAFSKSAGAKDNFVSLDAFRASLGGTRAEQDAAIRSQRIAGRYSLDTHEGRVRGATDAQKAAAIHEAGSRFVYISRK